MRITVSKEDIKSGKVKSYTSCPIALAAIRRWPGDSKKVRVGGNWISFDRGKTSITLPNDAKSFINDFDAGYKVKPFAFEVEVL